MSVAALFTCPGTPYADLGLECWDEARDARNYDGPGPVILHPPCERWGRWWYADGSREPGNDAGIFAFALHTLCKRGGVLEHPQGSHAWSHYGFPRPTQGAWIRSLFAQDLWTTEVAQRNYGHRARKLTWLLYVGANPPPLLNWETPEQQTAYLCPPGRRGPGQPGRVDVERLTPQENLMTPLPFARLMIELAEWSAMPRPSKAALPGTDARLAPAGDGGEE